VAKSQTKRELLYSNRGLIARGLKRDCYKHVASAGGGVFAREEQQVSIGEVPGFSNQALKSRTKFTPGLARDIGTVVGDFRSLPGQPPARRLTHYMVRLLALGSTEIPTGELARSALVFSPHPDDECLGCGGTIIRKKQAGATVKIVHLTDGSRSHPPDLISREQLAATRAREALNAGAALGVDDIYFLDFQDGALGGSMAPAIQRVAEIIRKEKPEEVFVPYVREPFRQAADHIATTRIVFSALQSLRRLGTTRVWEYPVWFWLHWPWVGLRKGLICRREVAKNSLRLGFGLRAFQELRCAVDISEVLERKIAALSEHRTQMNHFIPGSTWATLGKILGGQFLECFYTDYEFFRCSSYPHHD
jgi:LmbE family N-acetylglucosaminyl deacetylase